MMQQQQQQNQPNLGQIKARVVSNFNFAVLNHCRPLLIGVLTVYLIVFSYTNKNLTFPGSEYFCPLLNPSPATATAPENLTVLPKVKVKAAPAPTNLSHLVFGLLGSEKAWRYRKNYIESWWRANVTRGFLFLDSAPAPDLLPWPATSPPYRISDELPEFANLSEIRPKRMVHGIKEVLREVGDEKELRWVIMGDDDSIFFVDNMVDVLSKYDHTRYHYIGGQSEYLMSNFWFSFDQGYGGAGIILSYPLAKALAGDMENCLRRYVFLNSADNTTRNCIADIGVNVSPYKGNHQVDLHGDISGFLSAHPVAPVTSLHHFDVVEPIFPAKDRFEATRHLMTAAEADQSRLLQQTVCYSRERNWSLSVSWGYSAQIYERIMPRSYLQIPVETFTPWLDVPSPVKYMFQTRKASGSPCRDPHMFFYAALEKRLETKGIVTRYSRAGPRGLGPCLSSGNHSADSIDSIDLWSPATKRTKVDRCECCDVVRIEGKRAEIKLRKCRRGEVIA
ncbi:uncharacterized protein LOC127258978 [Andrographis paniculata]|uniref:uncharacterized protein LOC127258978 n=1 Tax=Andrographis paniculata TaxID=175694 RepID=UPI0021E99F8A|nr:uncharacterized protein LOC127258978 [Andrographis paniculata]